VFGAITTAAFTGLATSLLASFDDSRDLEEDYFGGFLSTIFNYSEKAIQINWNNSDWEKFTKYYFVFKT